MKYVVRCFCCDKIFVMDRAETGADIICPDCGSAIPAEETAQANTCKSCGSTVSGSDKFCPSCGIDLTSSDEE